MEVTGKIVQKLNLQSGVSKAGKEWKKQDYVLETKDEYPKTICFGFFGDKVDTNQLNIGDEAHVFFDIESREYNGKWYTNINAYKAEVVNEPVPEKATEKKSPKSKVVVSESVDDLPF